MVNLLMNFTSLTFVNQIDKHFFLGADLFTVPWQTIRLWLCIQNILHTNRAVFTKGKDKVRLLIDDKVK